MCYPKKMLFFLFLCRKSWVRNFLFLLILRTLLGSLFLANSFFFAKITCRVSWGKTPLCPLMTIIISVNIWFFLCCLKCVLLHLMLIRNRWPGNCLIAYLWFKSPIFWFWGIIILKNIVRSWKTLWLWILEILKRVAAIVKSIICRILLSFRQFEFYFFI